MPRPKWMDSYLTDAHLMDYCGVTAEVLPSPRTRHILSGNFLPRSAYSMAQILIVKESSIELYGIQTDSKCPSGPLTLLHIESHTMHCEQAQVCPFRGLIDPGMPFQPEASPTATTNLSNLKNETQRSFPQTINQQRPHSFRTEPPEKADSFFLAPPCLQPSIEKIDHGDIVQDTELNSYETLKKGLSNAVPNV
ncbi:hypothetical protein CANCADRAFT_32796, partial [Tortispora caseinolytica NRRL Y-17796]